MPTHEAIVNLRHTCDITSVRSSPISPVRSERCCDDMDLGGLPTTGG